VDGDNMTRGDIQPPRFNRGEVLTASALNKLSGSIGAIVRRMFGPRIIQPLNLQAVLDEDLFAAEDTFTDPSTAIATILIRDRFGNLRASTRKETVVNRNENISIDKDTYIKIEWIEGEWQPYSADCAPFSESLSQPPSDSLGASAGSI
jgi:hypothetical protein